MAREFIAPGNIFTGAGALDMAEDKLSQLGKKALIVTDNVMVTWKLCKSRGSIKKRKCRLCCLS